ncbi:MAG: HAD family phosphatase [Eubacterium sp.]|nr:HAD family phosphatase [Eubacterium sp.]
MKDKKILFFDIDGTLITDDERRILPEDTKEALKKAKENGCLLFINTGRVFSNVEDYIKEGFDGLICGCGTYIVYHDEVLLHHKQTIEKCREIALVCRETGMEAIFEYADRSCYDKTLKMDYIKDLIGYFKDNKRWVVDDIDSPDFIFDKLSAFYGASSDLKGFREYIEKEWTYIDREGNFCEIEPKGFSKASGIKFLTEHFGIPEENVYVFGDSNNDLEMLGTVKNSVAMGNATIACKEIASYVTTKVDCGGISNALKHFGLI